MNCHIVKHKDGDEFLIPGCYGVMAHYHLDLPDRELIREYCYCVITKKEKYETKTRDEVFEMISILKSKIIKQENELAKMKEDVFGLEAEVFMLNTVVIFDSEKFD